MQTNENETQESNLNNAAQFQVGRAVNETVMRSLGDRHLRERCLEFAHKGDYVGRSPQQIIDRAKAFEKYVLGGDDAD